MSEWETPDPGAVTAFQVLPEGSDGVTPVRTTTALLSAVTPTTWSLGPTDTMCIDPTISVHLEPLARLSFSPDRAPRTPFRTHTLESLVIAQTTLSPTATFERPLPPGGASTEAHPSPLGQSRVTPVLKEVR